MLLPYNQKLKKRSQRLRSESTLSEVLLWNEIKNKKLGVQFLRQKPIGNYIVDFYCARLRLIIEIDGSSHDFKQDYDSFRYEYFKTIGLTVIKFTDIEIKRNLEAVLRSLNEKISEMIPPLKKGVS